MRTINCWWVYWSILSLLLGAGLADAQKMYNLGGFDNTTGGTAMAVNNKGQVTGWSYIFGTYPQAFLWTPGATDGVPSNPQMKNLGTLGANQSEGLAINDSGQVAGVSFTSPSTGFELHPFLWTPGGTDGVAGNRQMKDLGTLGPGKVYSSVVAVNARGQVIGHSQMEPFLWTPGATDGVPGNPQMKDLGSLGGGGDVWLGGINASGQVSGWSYLPDHHTTHGFLWAPGATNGVPGNPQMKDLGTLGGNTCFGGFINSRGQIAGSCYLAGDTNEHAFLWTSGATNGITGNPQMKDLGTLGGSFSRAKAINDSGQVAGESDLPSGEMHVFLWTPGGTGGVAGNPQMEDLGSLGTTCDCVVSMNARGQVLGYFYLGQASGIVHAFLWTPGATAVDLGTLGISPGHEYSNVFAINDNGQVVGESDGHAFLYGTVPTLGPFSQVSPLPSNETVANFPVQWSGMPQSGLGIRDFNIYVSDNGGQFTVWLSQTTTTHSTFAGTAGHSYGFYSVARDNIGNYRNPKTAADATTYVASAGIGDVNADGQVNCADLAVVKASFGKRSTQAGYDKRADVHHDGIVDVRDLSLVSQQLVPGTKCQ